MDRQTCYGLTAFSSANPRLTSSNLNKTIHLIETEATNNEMEERKRKGMGCHMCQLGENDLVNCSGDYHGLRCGKQICADCFGTIADWLPMPDDWYCSECFRAVLDGYNAAHSAIFLAAQTGDYEIFAELAAGMSNGIIVKALQKADRYHHPDLIAKFRHDNPSFLLPAELREDRVEVIN